jgi:hypothetical protein
MSNKLETQSKYGDPIIGGVDGTRAEITYFGDTHVAVLLYHDPENSFNLRLDEHEIDEFCRGCLLEEGDDSVEITGYRSLVSLHKIDGDRIQILARDTLIGETRYTFFTAEQAKQLAEATSRKWNAYKDKKK